ncbi:T9SS type A sorting domain-containing protein [Seonamhaeicola sp. MEBiC1930]|uniref:LamG-like jellyroll fold domain-containing protein n=1 Tax=Seonamhaeicola sp. MEBiC01930 TaxID=2976768 RepID=UPI003252D932
MNTKKKYLKTMLSIFAIMACIALQAQTPVVHLKFENNLNNDGSGGLTFEVGGANSTGVSVPYSSGSIASLLSGVGNVNGSAEGTYAINFSVIGDDTDPNYALIQNGGSYDAQIQSTGNSTITGSDARTVSAWVRYDDRLNTTNGSHTIVNMGDPLAPGGSYGRTTFTFAAANNEIQLGISGANLKHFYTNGEGLENGSWHHVAYTYPTGGMVSDIVYYVDGVAVTDNDAGGGGNENIVLATTADKIYIGTRGNNSTKWFDGGGIDDVRVYDVALTPTQMLAVYNENALSIAGFAYGEIKAYPTVVEDFLNIETASKGELNVSVFDITGKVISETTGNSVDMRALNSGIYIVKVREANKVANLKILKK